MNQKIVNILSKYFENQPIEKAWVFGSFARSEERKNSDIDILVHFLPNTKLTLLNYAHIINELQDLTGKKVDLVEDGQLKPFAIPSSENDKVLIYERKT